ncbi:PTS system lactose/cellobiose-specific transporter subunit IIB [Perkinsela sp. CCAP 1560/4]|nr:PTS system lactose/cellobiose-specific transporter subunit IIB [Perkinsela sp. CCAP 1560/4]|eukprot:KNH08131.1 PTS system lactose/cellobiose-specific transporter subunit IIB [Perkinsela sp. CCAP 1560/4]
MPRILTKSSQDETICTPKRKLTQSSRHGSASSTRKKRSKEMIATAHHLKGLVIEVDGEVLNDDNGIFLRAISKGDFDLAELLLQLQSVVEKLEEIGENPGDFDVSARKIRHRAPSFTPAESSPAATRASTGKPLATPYRSVVHDSESEASPRTSATPGRKSRSSTAGTEPVEREENASKSAVEIVTPKKTSERVSEGVSPDHPKARLSKSPTFFERIRNRISFGLTS